MNIFTWNINGYNTCNCFRGYDQVLREAPDFICFQEVKISNPNELNNIFTTNYEKFYNFSKRKGKNGVFIYSKISPKNVFYKIGFEEFDKDGRFLCLEFSEFYLINVYMPHGGRDKSRLPYKIESYNYLREYIVNTLKEKPLIMVGDYNIAHTELDLERVKSNTNNIMFSKEERDIFSDLLSIGLIDVFREIKPLDKEYTWWPYAFEARKRNVGWRIDYLLASQNAFEFDDISIRKDILGSDHCPIKASFNIKIE